MMLDSVEEVLVLSRVLVIKLELVDMLENIQFVLLAYKMPKSLNPPAGSSNAKF